MRTPSLIVLAALTAICAPAAAQYKWTAANGVVNYSDLPPPPGVNGVSTLSSVRAPDDGGQIPAGLRDAASKYPVVLYTTSDCAPCQQARSHLARRGIPFAERTVKTSADADAFKRLGFTDNAFPSLTVGRERASGFEAGEWDRALDAAGYPKNATLPPSYRSPPAQALAPAAPRRPAVAPEAPGADAQADAGDAPRDGVRRRPTPVTASGPPPGQPAIRF